jgi:hypothetical protein
METNPIWTSAMRATFTWSHEITFSWTEPESNSTRWNTSSMRTYRLESGWNVSFRDGSEAVRDPESTHHEPALCSRAVSVFTNIILYLACSVPIDRSYLIVLGLHFVTYSQSRPVPGSSPLLPMTELWLSRTMELQVPSHKSKHQTPYSILFSITSVKCLNTNSIYVYISSSSVPSVRRTR